MSVGFSQSFPIELNIISRALRAHDDNPDMSKKQIAAEIGLNKPKMDGISAWLRYFELWQHKEGTLPLGKILLQNDKYFSNIGTQLLLHYILATNSDAEVWSYGFTNYFEIGKSFEREDFYNELLTDGIGQNTKYLSTDVGILLNSYTVHDDAFKAVSIFHLEDNIYTAKSPNINPPIFIVAYALYRWREEMGNITTTSVEKLLNDPNQVGRIFFLTRLQLQEILRDMETLGLIRITNVADLDNISYTFDGVATDLLVRHYDAS